MTPETNRMSRRSHAPVQVDTLRERLAGPELAAARVVLDRAGVTGLLGHAANHLATIAEVRARFEALARDVEARPAERDALVEAYLRETVEDARALASDLRTRRKSGGELVDLGALGERVVRRVADLERAIEATLSLARAALVDGYSPPLDLAPLIALARTPGRWSRRTEALGLMAELGRRRVGATAEQAIAEVARELVDRSEHRWVQPAALGALASVDAKEALAIARERLTAPEQGDDFLVRERIVDLAARGGLGAGAWAAVAELACADASEHVRITLARGERDPLRLERLAARDASEKVRATALISLASLDPDHGARAIAAALCSDPSAIVVRIAAEEAASLARRDGLRDHGESAAALAVAATREDMPAEVRASVTEALADLAVFTDDLARSTYDILAPIAADTPVGSRSIVKDTYLEAIDDERLGRVLAVLARDDHALGADRIPGGIVLHRGEARRFAAWRALYELGNPSPSKRQAFDHTLARRPAGALRAPPGGLAELTATQVPGERVFVDRIGGWGRHLPLVDDLLSTGVVKGKTVSLYGATGTTIVTPPKTFAGRLRAWATLTLRYARFAELRRRALDSDEPSMQAKFVNEVERSTRIAVQYEPHTFTISGARIAAAAPRGVGSRAPRPAEIPVTGEPGEASSRPVALALAPLAAIDWSGLRDLGRDLVTYATSPQGNRLAHLAAYTTVMLGAFLVRGVAIRRSIERDRDAIPLVIGGWGTRGKSGTERLKAALFQGLGHEVLVKTTGCEAMFIHAIPGQPAREVFIYRPYDKATVWEQRDVLALARSFGVRVFLWECMALQPDLVNLLQAQWMRDDFSTITNAYPDHEDVQGPSGWDVANVISEFVPTRGNLLTSEEQMLPILKERARERGTTVRVIKPREADLLADDLLARFPYAEHPKNIALVAGLARALGVPAAVALAEMADHVVPDLGVLKEYPTVPHRDRTLSFVNGMSANERTAALENWTRMGFDDHDPERDRTTWQVTVVNNRADRVARSEVFARFLVEDTSAHRHVLIGSNVSGLRGFLDQALQRHLARVSPTHELVGDGSERLKTARARLDRAFARLKIGRLDPDSVLAEVSALGGPELDRALVERLLEPELPDERYEHARAAVEAGLPASLDGELRPFVVQAIARRRAVRAVHAVLARDLGGRPTSVDAAFARTYRAIFAESIVAIDDPATSGDRILDAIARSVPPGVHARIIGLQNIKGTGLDFVYRWVSIDAVTKHLEALRSPLRARREEALRALAMHGDYGVVDARYALQKVEESRADDEDADELPYDVALARLREIVAAREKKLVAKRSRSASEAVRGWFGKTFDYLDSTRRRRMANELLEALITQRMSHAAAAKKMREIVARTKGAWALAQ